MHSSDFHVATHPAQTYRPADLQRDVAHAEFSISPARDVSTSRCPVAPSRAPTQIGRSQKISRNLWRSPTWHPPHPRSRTHNPPTSSCSTPPPPPSSDPLSHELPAVGSPAAARGGRYSPPYSPRHIWRGGEHLARDSIDATTSVALLPHDRVKHLWATRSF